MTAEQEPGGPRPEERPATVLGTPVRRIARLWWVIVLVTGLAVGAGVVATMESPTTYTGRASLIVASNNRSPDQDAVLVQGYVAYFNEASYQRELASQADVTEPVSLMASAAASSPILLVESTADSPEVASESAAAVAEAFQADINQVRDQEQESQINQLEDRIEAATAAGGANAPSAVSALRDQISQIEADRTNRLQELQFDGGVSTNSPSLVANVGLGGVAGLVLGFLVALGLARVFGRR